jgi:signal peptidase II
MTTPSHPSDLETGASTGARGLASRDAVVFTAVALGVVALDQVTKSVVRDRLPVGASWPGPDSPLARFFTFTHVANTGVSFGMFQGRSEIFLLLSLVVIVALLLYRRRVPEGALWLNVALGLQVGGAVGNMLDRARFGPVTDFLDFQFWPVFNVADSAIFLGTVLLVWHLWRDERDARLRAEQAALEGAPSTGARAPGARFAEESRE